MPPFPRASNTEPPRPPEAAAKAPEGPAPSEPNRSSATPDPLSTAPDTTRPADPEGDYPYGADTRSPGDSQATASTTGEGNAATDGLDFTAPDELDDDIDLDEYPGGDDDEDDDDGDVEEFNLGADYDDDDPDFDDDEEDPEASGTFRSAVAGELARRAERSLLNGMEHVADTFDETAHRIARIAQLRGGPEALTLGPVHSTVGWLEGAADYLRTSDLEAVQSDLRGRVRARPVQSLGIALCAGWLLGRILR